MTMTNQLAQFTEPNAACPELIDAIHRGHDGWITFHTKEEQAGHRGFDIAACKAADVLGVFPEYLRPWLNADAYFSNNGMVMNRIEMSQASSRVPTLPRCARSNDHIRYLTAAWVDLDVYNAGVTVGYALGVIHDWAQEKKIPPPSWFVDSGQGAWVGWLICDTKNRELPQAAWPEQLSTWRRIMRRLQYEFRDLGADAQSMDFARIMRVPGTINTKNGRRVSHWIPKDAQNRSFVYTMDDLAVWLGVPPARHSPGVKRITDPRYYERGRKGHIAANSNRYKALVELASARGKIRGPDENGKGGCRQFYLHQLAVTGFKLRNDGLPEWAELVRQVARYQCDPPFDADETEATIEGAIKFAKKRCGATYMMNRYKLANQLGVTEAEATRLPDGADAGRAGRLHRERVGRPSVPLHDQGRLGEAGHREPASAQGPPAARQAALADAGGWGGGAGARGIGRVLGHPSAKPMQAGNRLCTGMNRPFARTKRSGRGGITMPLLLNAWKLQTCWMPDNPEYNGEPAFQGVGKPTQTQRYPLIRRDL